MIPRLRRRCMYCSHTKLYEHWLYIFPVTSLQCCFTMHGAVGIILVIWNSFSYFAIIYVWCIYAGIFVILFGLEERWWWAEQYRLLRLNILEDCWLYLNVTFRQQAYCTLAHFPSDVCDLFASATIIRIIDAIIGMNSMMYFFPTKFAQ